MSSNPYASPQSSSYGKGGHTKGQAYTYRSAEDLVFWVSFAIIAMLLSDGILTSTNVILSLAFPGLLDKEVPTWDEAVTVMTFGLCLGVGSLGLLAGYVVSVIMFSICINRFNKNARALESKAMEYTPAWAVGWFFIPIANLFMPYKVVSEIYRASDPQTSDLDWRMSPIRAPIGWWWVIWIISNIVDNCEALVSFWETDVPSEVSVPLSILSFALTVVAGVLAILVMRAILARQEAKARFRASRPPVVPQGFGDAMQ